ncbi:S8 family serine peptidase [Cryptosporangium arvum]|uniref:Subtilase family protease/peptidase inhibitor I9 n=1 Tax=Cryptosporangium arvum DSM 44712 TaxID=927661 RepID=A0A010ZPD1_9ACTN|nr:S8 family serine peptidase [Cryptosporangium arvum]EXG79087.1 subtilase family protease/peptidase inhibitor I9 [Cryptosporangium arvum DSM 44712]
MRRPVGFTSAGLALGLAIPSGALAAPSATPDEPAVMHLVQLVDAPIAAYPGGRSVPDGVLDGTRPRRGQRLGVDSVAVRRYRAYLDQQLRAVLKQLPGVRTAYAYRWTFNGFAAALTPDQVAAARRLPGVRSVTRDSVRTLDGLEPAGTTEFLGLPGPTGAWERLDGPARAGAGTVIGFVDSGIWSAHPSFTNPRPAAPRYRGTCDAGRVVKDFRCRGALVGARWYLNGLTPDAGEPRSPADHDGHGTHAAAVAAGAADVTAKFGPHELGAVSGVAPAARIAAYKACWQVDGEPTCAESDTVAAIDQAVADGVDVLNVAVDGASGGSPADDPLASSLYRAAQAGVFVAASAGNDGPSTRTAHGKPWLTSVAAGTHDRAPVAVVRLGDGTRLNGAGLGAGVPARPVVPGGQCREGSLDPGKIRGRIVVCLRGGNGRADKSAEVERAGGAGMVLANDDADELTADRHAVPTVNVDVRATAKLRDYLRDPRASAAFEPARMRPSGAPRPEVAEFSSRGPDGDALAPDLMAPGVDVVAAVSPARDGAMFGLRSGTSVATAQVSGAAALLRGAHPRWSPAAVKSALLTSATGGDNRISTSGGETAGPAEYGAGALAVDRALDPGLLFDSSAAATAPYSAQNTASVVLGSLAGVRTVRRTVTNVGSGTARYVARVDEPPGVDVAVSPAELTLEPGATASFTVTVHRVSAPYDQLAAGSITWSDGVHPVRVPVAVTPVVVAAPSSVELGNSLTVVPGFTGRLSARIAGPVPAVGHTTRLRVTGERARFSSAAPKASDRVARFTVTVPSDTALARFATDALDYPVGTDVDVFVYRDGKRVGRSGGPAADERIDLPAPEAGRYDVYVQLVDAPGTGALPVRLDSYVIDDGEPAAERSVNAGTPLRLSGVPAEGPGRWLGQIRWSDGGTGEATTLVSAVDRVFTDAPAAD